jgi:hypothetical protein
MLWFKPAFIEADINRTTIKNKKNGKDVLSAVSTADSVIAGTHGTTARCHATDGQKP